MTVLLLAGTREARELSFALEGADLISSLAGATLRPAALGGRTRIGGFGGENGLADFLRAECVSQVIDATHPFAAKMSTNAYRACAALGVPLLQLVRPAWAARPDWVSVADLDEAAGVLDAGTCVFLATGRASLDHFKGRDDVDFVVRVIDDIAGAFPLTRGRFLASKPPFTVAQEVATLASLGASTLVARNSGGTGGIEKVDAATKLGIRVVMVERPDLPVAQRVASVKEALAYLGRDR